MTNCKTILIIEDDHDTRVTLRDALEREGYSVMTAATGQAGLDLLASAAKPALILLDMSMPLMGGAEFLARIRKDPVLGAIPIAVISANADPKQAQGAKAFLRKPLDLEIVLKLVKRYCG